jgi:hypothetical protein
VKPVRYGQAFRVGGMTVTFFDAGHILGSAMVLVEADGRRLRLPVILAAGTAIIHDPQVLPPVDLLITGDLGIATAAACRGNGPSGRGSDARRPDAAAACDPAFAIGRRRSCTLGFRSSRTIPDKPVTWTARWR